MKDLETKRLMIELTEPAYENLCGLVTYGFFGRNPEEAAARIVEEYLRGQHRDGLLAESAETTEDADAE
jgi:hypothetical protein